MGVSNRSTMFLPMMSILLLGTSAKPSFTANREERLYNRRGWLNSIGDTFNSIGGAIVDTANQVGDTVSDWAEETGVNDWDDVIVDTANQVGDTVSNWAEDTGVNTWDDVIVDTANQVGDTVSDWADTVVDSVQQQKRNALVDSVQHQKRAQRMSHSVNSIQHQNRYLPRDSPEVFDPNSAEDLLRLKAAGKTLTPQQNALLQRALSSGKALISIERPDPYSLEQFNSIENDPYSLEVHSPEVFDPNSAEDLLKLKAAGKVLTPQQNALLQRALSSGRINNDLYSLENHSPEDILRPIRPKQLGQHLKQRLYNRRGWLDSIGDTFNNLGDAIVDTANQVGDTVGDWAEETGVNNWDDVIVDTANQVGDTVGDWAEETGVNDWDDAIADTANQVGDWTKDTWNDVVSIRK